MKRVLGLLLAGATGAVLGGCGGGHPGREEASGTPIAVQLEASRITDISRGFETGGVVRARTTASVVSRIVAEVRAVLARPGDRVKAGQPLVLLDARDLHANLARAEATAAAADQAVKGAATLRDAAEASLTLAAATHKRIAGLHARNSATPSELDQAVSGLRGAEAQAQGALAGIRQAEAGAVAARAALDGARVGLSYATITAPFDGIVTEKLVEPGNMASPAAPLMTVEDVRGFRLEVRVDESRVGEIDPARPVRVTLDSAPLLAAASATPPGPVLNAALAAAIPPGGRIVEVSRALDPGSHAYLVKIDLPESAAARSGMFGRARFEGPARKALVVPETAIVRRGQLTSVFVVGGDKRARVRMVSLGDTADGLAEVAAGLDAGERVVRTPPPSLTDGARVEEVRR